MNIPAQIKSINKLIKERNNFWANYKPIPFIFEIIKIEQYKVKPDKPPVTKFGYDIYYKCKKGIEHFIVGVSFTTGIENPEKITLFNY